MIRNKFLAAKKIFDQKNIFKNKDVDFVAAIVISIFLHLILAYLFFFGSPTMFSPLPENKMIITEIVPISQNTNVKNKETIDKVTKETPTSSKKDIAKSKDKEISEKKPDTKINDKKLKDNKKPDIKNKKKDEKKIKAPAPKVKNKPKKQAKKEKKKKTIDENFDSLLQNLEKSSKIDANKKQAKETKDLKISQKSKGEFNNEAALSITEQHAIKAQIERFWNVPIGVKNAHDIKITLYIALKIDGSVEKIALVNKKCPLDSSRECQAAIDSAIRAVKMASPLEGLTNARYHYWKEFNFEFDPTEIMN